MPPAGSRRFIVSSAESRQNKGMVIDSFDDSCKAATMIPTTLAVMLRGSAISI